MRNMLFIFVMSIFVSSCTMVAVPDDAPVFTATYKGNYASIGDCTFARLQRELGQVSLAHLSSQKAVQLSEGEYRGIRWTMEIRDVGDGTSSVVFRSYRAVWGPNFYADQVRPSLEACVP